MNILFLHEVDWLRKVVFDVHWLAEAMSLRGHNIYALYYESLWGLNGWKTPKHTMSSRVFDDAKVKLICPSFVRFPVVSRVSAFATHYFEIKKAIKDEKIDVIILYSVPTNGWQAVHWAKHFGIPIVFRSIDIINQLVPSRILRYPTKMLERKVYSNVDRFLAITPKLCDYAVRLGADPNKVGVLPIPVDTELFKPLDVDWVLRRKWGFEDDDKIILYMGTLFNFSGLDRFMPQFYQIVRQIPKAKLLIVGDGEQRKALEDIIWAYSLAGKVIITGFQPYKEISRYISLADVCINPFVVCDATRDIFPGKTAQMLACGKPVVMRPLDGVKALIEGENQGVVYALADGQMRIEVITLLLSSEKRNAIGQNGLRYARENHDYREVARQLEEILGELD